MSVSFSLAAAVGAALGFLAGIGVGGGSLLMLWLTLAVGMEPEAARCINLLFFIPCALCSSLFRLRQSGLSVKKVFLPAAAGCITAAAASYLGAFLPVDLLKKAFGLLLLFTGFKELGYGRKNTSRGL